MLPLQGEIPGPRLRASCSRLRKRHRWSRPRVPERRVVDGPREGGVVEEGRMDLGREAEEVLASVPVVVERGGRRAEGEVKG